MPESLLDFVMAAWHVRCVVVEYRSMCPALTLHPCGPGFASTAIPFVGCDKRALYGVTNVWSHSSHRSFAITSPANFNGVWADIFGTRNLWWATKFLESHRPWIQLQTLKLLESESGEGIHTCIQHEVILKAEHAELQLVRCFFRWQESRIFCASASR